MVEEPKQPNYFRRAVRLTGAVAVGLLVSGVWWEYSDKIIGRILLIFGVQ
jgi:hypothetical protein